MCISLIPSELKTQITAVRKGKKFTCKKYETARRICYSNKKTQQVIKAKHCRITKVTDFTVGMFRTENQQFPYRVIISVRLWPDFRQQHCQSQG